MDKRATARRVMHILVHLRPLRAFGSFRRLNGPVLAAGLTYQWVFTLFSLLWLVFSLAGLIFRGNAQLQRGLLMGVDVFLPGLIGGSTSPVPLDAVLDPGVVRVSLVVALISSIVTGLGFIAATRAAIRALAGLPSEAGSYLRLKVRDLGLALLFGLLLVVGTALSVFATLASPIVLGWFGRSGGDLIGHGLTVLVGLLLVTLVNTCLILGLLRVIGQLQVQPAAAIAISLATGACWALLQTVASGLLTTAYSNPLYSSFAVLFGFFLYLYVIFQLLLYAVAWLAEADRQPDR